MHVSEAQAGRGKLHSSACCARDWQLMSDHGLGKIVLKRKVA